MSEPVWLEKRALELLHSECIAEHGGAAGLRDEGLFESALARPQNLFAYENVDDPARLAASYAFGRPRIMPSWTGISGLRSLPPVFFFA
jgi:death-on-curing protein